jgi:hypothetical protein
VSCTATNKWVQSEDNKNEKYFAICKKKIATIKALCYVVSLEQIMLIR